MTEDRRQFDKVLEGKLNEILKYNKRQDEKIGDIHEVIHGNGNPDKGLVVKTAKQEEKINSLCLQLKLHWGVFIIIVGTLVKLAFF